MLPGQLMEQLFPPRASLVSSIARVDPLKSYFFYWHQESSCSVTCWCPAPRFPESSQQHWRQKSEGITCDIHILCHTNVILLGHLAGSHSQPMAGCYKPHSLNAEPKTLRINCKNKIKAGFEVASRGLTQAVQVDLLLL